MLSAGSLPGGKYPAGLLPDIGIQLYNHSVFLKNRNKPRRRQKPLLRMLPPHQNLRAGQGMLSVILRLQIRKDLSALERLRQIGVHLLLPQSLSAKPLIIHADQPLIVIAYLRNGHDAPVDHGGNRKAPVCDFIISRMHHQRMLQVFRAAFTPGIRSDPILQIFRADAAFWGKYGKPVCAPPAIDSLLRHNPSHKIRDLLENPVRKIPSVYIIDHLKIRDVGKDHRIFRLRRVFQLLLHQINEHLSVHHSCQLIMRLPIRSLPAFLLYLCVIRYSEKRADISAPAVFQALTGDIIILPVITIPDLCQPAGPMLHTIAVLDKRYPRYLFAKQPGGIVQAIGRNAKQGGRAFICVDCLPVFIEEQNRVLHIGDQKIMKRDLQENRPVLDGKEIQENAAHRKSDHGVVNRTIQKSRTVLP